MFQDGYIVFNCVGVYEPHPLPEPALNERKYAWCNIGMPPCAMHQTSQGVRAETQSPWDNMGEVSRGRYLGGECMPG